MQRFKSVDPLAADFAGWSPYNYVLGNPIILIDPDGRSPYSPIYDPNGNFLGTDSGGFAGDIIIMDRTAFNSISNNGKKTLNNDQVMIWADKSPLASKLNGGGLSAEGFSKVYTHVTKQLGGVNFDRLEGGIINTMDTPLDMETGQMGNTNGESFGNATNLPLNAEAGTMTNGDGSINVTTRLLGGTGQFETVEHTQSVLGVHEYNGHGIQDVPQAFPAHKAAYKLQYEHKATFNKLTPYQQGNIKTDAGIK